MISEFALNSDTMVNSEDNFLGYVAYGAHIVGDMSCVDELVKMVFPHNTKFVLIESIFVSPAARGKGYGTKFLEDVFAVAKESGTTEILAFIPTVDETESVFSGIKWLEHHGFSRLPGKDLEDMLMHKHLD